MTTLLDDVQVSETILETDEEGVVEFADTVFFGVEGGTLEVSPAMDRFGAGIEDSEIGVLVTVKVPARDEEARGDGVVDSLGRTYLDSEVLLPLEDLDDASTQEEFTLCLSVVVVIDGLGTGDVLDGDAQESTERGEGTFQVFSGSLPTFSEREELQAFSSLFVETPHAGHIYLSDSWFLLS